MEFEFGGSPLETGAKLAKSSYRRYSPHTKVRDWNTPTLVIHGAKDYRIAETEGISTFQALQRQGVPSQLLVFPTENHWCLNAEHSLVWHEAVFKWIDEWCGMG